MTRSARPDLAGVALLCVALGPGAARAAEPPSEYGPRNSASISVFSIFGPGLAVEYERYLPRWTSVATGLGFRTTGGSQYSTITFGPSVEARVWLYGEAPFGKLGRKAMVGPFLCAREDVSWTVVDDEVKKKLAGTALELSESLGFGYRLMLWRVAVTQTHGFVVTSQIDPRGRLAPASYLSLKLALNLGVLF